MSDQGADPSVPTPPPLVAPPQRPGPWVGTPKYDPPPPGEFIATDCFAAGWRLFTSHYLSLLGSVLLYQLLGFVVAIIPFVGGIASMFIQPLDAGVRCHVARLARGQLSTTSTIFQVFGTAYWSVFVTQLVVGILGTVLFIPLVACGIAVAITSQEGAVALGIAIGATVVIGLPAMIVGLWVMVRLQFAPVLSLDAPPGSCDLGHAIKLSWQRTRPFVWQLVGLMLLCWIAAALSILLLGVGLFLVGIPLTYAVMASAYVRLFPKFDAATCHHCGYDLRGSPGQVCPECGALPLQPTPTGIVP